MTERHAQRAGLVTNANPHGWPDNTRGIAFSSQSVCGRPECIDKAIRQVAGATNMTARFYPDGPMGGQLKDGPHEWTQVEIARPFLPGPSKIVWECDNHAASDAPHRIETIIPGTK